MAAAHVTTQVMEIIRPSSWNLAADLLGDIEREESDFRAQSSEGIHHIVVLLSRQTLHLGSQHSPNLETQTLPIVLSFDCNMKVPALYRIAYLAPLQNQPLQEASSHFLIPNKRAVDHQ